MKPNAYVVACAPVLLIAWTAQAQVPLGTDWTYQGKLELDGVPVNDTADFQFSLWDAAGTGAPPSGGIQVGSPLPKTNVTVVNGLFTVQLDFGAGVFNGDARWLQIAVRSPAGSGAFETLAPRQPLKAAPYAQIAVDALSAEAVPGIDGHSLDAADGAPADALFVDNAGNIGIGTTSPTSPLSFRNADERKITFGETAPVGFFGIDLLSGQLRTWAGLAGDLTFGHDNGVGGFTERMRVDGTSNGGRMNLKDAAGVNRVNAQATAHGGQVTVYGPAGGERAAVAVNPAGSGDVKVMGPNGSVNTWMTNVAGSNDHGWIGVFDSTGLAKAGLFVDSDGDGMMFTGVIQINGGSDIAEPFDVSADQAIEPGMVVAIDPERMGELRLTTTPYDRTVAGVISGAGGVDTGMMLRHSGTKADGEHPVALTGRVYCYVDADAGGPVKPGDLLTTSNTPGHAMRVTDHDRANGAILGKAMSSLENGRGLVLVLVSLQ